MQKMWLVGAEQNEDLQQSGHAATDWDKRAKDEGTSKDDYSRNLPHGN